MKEYFYSKGQDQQGPYSLEKLKECKITKETLIWFEGLENWTPAHEINELKSFINIESQAKNQKISNIESEKKLKIKELEDKIALNEKILANSPSNNNNTKSNNNTYKGLYCSSDDKIVLGLCGGLAHKFNLQSSVVRFGVVLVVVVFFFIGWFYLVGLFLPKLATK